MPDRTILDFAIDSRESFAKQRLTSPQAKLYSQNILKQLGRAGLATFDSQSIDRHISQGLFLIQTAIIEKDNNPDGPWKEGIKRAGEIFEWLSEEGLLPDNAPFHLLSAGAYQVAGFPALARGHLLKVPETLSESQILHSFFKADFLKCQNEIMKFWQSQLHLIENEADIKENISALISSHTVMCVGIVCHYIRTGDSNRLERAINKIEKLSRTYLHSSDLYSWVLGQLVAATSKKFIDNALWPSITNLQEGSSEETAKALDQFARSAYINGRVLIWPSQAVGISRLANNDSFVLCTPTGSGKTTIATLASIQALFSENPVQGSEGLENNLVLYLVPSRALAAEVEERFSQDLRGLSTRQTVVTGLYGGADWGPTDTWISSDQPTVLVCTYEKADALIRYLGILFLRKVRLIVIDEIHTTEYSKGNEQSLQEGTSRSFRLEMLGTRLLTAQEHFDFRIIALSAVAAKAGPALSRWISGDSTSLPASSDYRSTRQMLGRLEVRPNGGFKILYDLMNGHSLQFRDGGRHTYPFIDSPFPDLPGGINWDDGVQVMMRAPTLWAALHLSSRRTNNVNRTVLISITQDIATFADSCLSLLESWPEDRLPDYFDLDNENEDWRNCLKCAADYFTEDSLEYRLLKKGIVVHHGKMPPLLARKMKKVIDLGIVNVVIATSTLSEGVNIPVNYILIPSLHRGQTPFSVQELHNLIGRAGRPGIAAEGHALIVLPSTGRSREKLAYTKLKNEIEASQNQTTFYSGDNASSPLLNLLQEIKTTWLEISSGGTDEMFLGWLEQTATTEGMETKALKSLDSLDAFLLSSIQEIEKLMEAEISDTELEEVLIGIWQKTYAVAAAREEESLRNIWLNRGKVIKNFYPDRTERSKIYKTSLSPRSALKLIQSASDLKGKLEAGRDYVTWNQEERLEHIGDLIEMISSIPSFKLAERLGRNTRRFSWRDILRWWLARDTLATQPNPKKISDYYSYVSSNFLYKINWGLGSVINLFMEGEDEENPIRPLELDDWPRSGLPWIAFWLKEIIMWGTLDPAAAYLLARGDVISRNEAEEETQEYYNLVSEELNIGANSSDNNSVLDPRRIRDWAQERVSRETTSAQERIPDTSYPVNLSKPPNLFLEQHYNVYPTAIDSRIIWLDSAGYSLGNSVLENAQWIDIRKFEYVLDIISRRVNVSPYLKHT